MHVVSARFMDKKTRGRHLAVQWLKEEPNSCSTDFCQSTFLTFPTLDSPNDEEKYFLKSHSLPQFGRFKLGISIFLTVRNLASFFILWFGCLWFFRLNNVTEDLSYIQTSSSGICFERLKFRYTSFSFLACHPPNSIVLGNQLPQWRRLWCRVAVI